MHRMGIVWLIVAVFLVCHVSAVRRISNKRPPSTQEVQSIGTQIETYYSTGQLVNLVDYCTKIEKQYGTLELGFTRNSSSPYVYLGAALYSLHRTEEAITAFKKALIEHPENDNTMINLGEVQLQTFKLDDAMATFRKAYKLGNVGSLSRILRTAGWSADWDNMETYLAQLEELLNTCDDEEQMQRCQADSTASHEYTDTPIQTPRIADFSLPMNKLNPKALRESERAPLWSKNKPNSNSKSGKSPRLKVGLVSSDFNVHPVSQLIRGMIQFVDKERIELYCYSLQSQSSWWGDNITANVEHFVPILNMNHRDAAQLIANHQIEILIDLNGHTMFSGLPIFQFRPAPVQMSFLGLPTSTSADFIDFYLGDYVSNPPELREEFFESLALLPPSYIVSDYAQVVGDIADRDYDQRAPRSCFFANGATNKVDTPSPLDDATVLLGTFSNSQKMDPATFHLWMNIMNSVPGSKMIMMEYRGSEYFLRNLHRVTRSFGVDIDRYQMMRQISYIDHLDCKTSVDLAFDTIAKNGHTTGLDALWAGIPVLSLGGRNRALSRAAESMAVAMDHEVGLTYSMKEYEDLALHMLKAHRKKQESIQEPVSREESTVSSLQQQDPQKKQRRSKLKRSRKLTSSVPASDSSSGNDHSSHESAQNRFNLDVTQYNISASPLLLQWRREIIRQRRASTLFNTRLFTKFFERYMESIWEIVNLQATSPLLQQSIATHDKFQRRRRLFPNKQQFFHIFPAKSELPSFQATFQPLQTSTMRAIDSATQTTSSRDTAEDKKSNTPQGSNKNNQGTDQSLLHASMNKISGYLPKLLNYSDPRVLLRFSSNKGQRPWEEYEPIPSYVFDGRLLLLNVGGVRAAVDWLQVNNQKTNYYEDPKLNPIDIVRDMDDLFGLPDHSVAALYSSHTLEHQTLAGGKIENTLREWFRVIRPGGLLFVSVPDISVLARMILDTSLTFEEHMMVIKMMYGGQFDAGDFHHVGFTEEFLTVLLEHVGFCEIERVKEFNLEMKSPHHNGIVQDSSSLVRYGYFISLNMVARVCPTAKPTVDYDGFLIQHAATKYDGYWG